MIEDALSDKEYEKKMIKLRQEIEANKLEAERRRQVARTKFFGYLIEQIDLERENLRREKERRETVLSALITASGSEPNVE